MEDFEIISVGDEGNERDNGGSSVSAAKLKANRKNARRSTGPKTDAGKNHSRLNALKHGVLASVLVVSGGAWEDPAEFEELLSALARDLEPVGKLEEMLVEKIAVCWWRQKRAVRFEALMIQQGSKQAAAPKELENKMLMEIIGRAQEVMARHGITADMDEEPRLVDPQLERSSHAQTPFQQRKTNDDVHFFDNIRDDYFRLPEDEVLNRILRYETSIQRQLAQAINQLERLQRARKGEHVPAPVTVQVSTDH
jgi:hypothetical protein